MKRTYEYWDLYVPTYLGEFEERESWCTVFRENTSEYGVDLCVVTTVSKPKK